MILYYGISYIPVSGSVSIGSSDVVLAATVNPSVDTVNFNRIFQWEDYIRVTFYCDECSDIKMKKQVLDYSDSLTIKDGKHLFKEIYLTKGSTIRYFFLPLQSMQTTNCVAKLYIFHDFDNYIKWKNGIAQRESSSYCLPPDSPLTLTLSKVRYYFVGLETNVPITLNYTVTGTVLKYNTNTNYIYTLHFQDMNGYDTCSLSLPDDYNETVCILATADGHLTLHYTHDGGSPHEIAAFVIYGIGFFLFLLVRFTHDSVAEN